MSTVPGRILTRTRRRLRTSSGAPGSAGFLQLAGGSAGAPALGPGRRLSWRALLAGALLCLALGVALYVALSGGPSSAVGRFSVGHALRAGASARQPGASTQLPRASARRARATSHDTKGLSSLPAMAQGPVSEALGAERPAYSGTPGRRRIFRGERRAASAGTLLPQRGVLQLRRRAARAEPARGRLRRIAQVAARDRSAGEGQSRVYARAGLTESYVERAARPGAGLHDPQSALPAHPAGAADALDGALGQRAASLGAGAKSITLSRSGRPELRYNGLSATDARGHACTAGCSCATDDCCSVSTPAVRAIRCGSTRSSSRAKSSPEAARGAKKATSASAWRSPRKAQPR